MKKTALVVMAAGIGSRFGGGIKQLEPVGPNGEIIMDYSIHDALEAGFNKVVFIIRKDLEKDFREIIGNRIEKITEVCLVYTSFYMKNAYFHVIRGAHGDPFLMFIEESADPVSYTHLDVYKRQERLRITWALPLKTTTPPTICCGRRPDCTT